MSLKQMMKDSGVRQRVVAAEFGVSEPTVSRWVRGTASLPIHFVEPLAKLLNVEVAVVVRHGQAHGRGAA